MIKLFKGCYQGSAEIGKLHFTLTTDLSYWGVGIVWDKPSIRITFLCFQFNVAIFKRDNNELHF